MTSPDLEVLIEQYRAGLEAEIALLLKLEAISAQQRAASDARDLDALNGVSDARDRLTAGLVSIEEQLRRVRRDLSESRVEARLLPGYSEAVALHHEAIALVTRILDTDKASLQALATAELARRDAVRAVEQGETTLSAYRKVMVLAPGATLVDRRG
jgi:hypothetical protein